jgi:ribosomal protein S18 acetylase RimI-like enzyme
MIKFNPVKTTDTSYAFVENLLHESFPEEERRDDDMQRYNTDNNPLFTTYLITDDAEYIGLITLWKLSGFLYVEHLATSPSVRNKGYGKMIMQALLKIFPDSKIVLEV